MGYTKQQFVSAALEEIGLASYVFDLQPEQLQSALRRLDAMMADWNGKGIRLGYPLPSSPQDSDLDEETLVPDSAYETIICSLGIWHDLLAVTRCKPDAEAANDGLVSRVRHKCFFCKIAILWAGWQRVTQANSFGVPVCHHCIEAAQSRLQLLWLQIKNVGR